jgi:acetyl-CoA carboxylase biotin carboxyl carrier protein
MDIKKIKALAEIIKNYGITSLTITEGDITVSMQREQKEQTDKPAINKEDNQKTPENETSIENMYNFSDVNEVKSPLVGIFYIAPAPEAKPYVEIGSKVKKGDTLCMVEAMKLLNEINAENDYEIVDICVKNGEIVEYGQTLFKVI